MTVFSRFTSLPATLQASLMMHADFREAYEAFVEKRDPRFL